MNLQKQYIEFIKSGLKTIEGRLNKEKFQAINQGDLISFYVKERPDSCCACKVIRIALSSKEMLCQEGLNRCLPHAKTWTKVSRLITASQGIEKEYGVIAIE